MLSQAASVDWLFSGLFIHYLHSTRLDVFNSFVLALDSISDTIQYIIFDSNLNRIIDLELSGSWTEGPGIENVSDTYKQGIISKPDKHALPNATNFALAPLDIMRSVGTPGQPITWQLAHIGADLFSQNIQTVNYSSLFSGFLIESQGLPLALIIGTILHS